MFNIINNHFIIGNHCLCINVFVPYLIWSERIKCPCWIVGHCPRVSVVLWAALHMGKLRINPLHMWPCAPVTCEIYSAALSLLRRRDQRPHYIVKSVNQLENQSEVWPQSCQESMERNYNDRITQQTKSLQSRPWYYNNLCSFEMDHTCVGKLWVH